MDIGRWGGGATINTSIIPEVVGKSSTKRSGDWRELL